MQFALEQETWRTTDDIVFLGEIQEYEPLSRAAYHKAMKEFEQRKDIEKTKNFD